MDEEFENTPGNGGADRVEFLKRKAARLESEAARWRREEAALRDVERRYLALLENPLFILMIISGGRVTFLNGRGEAFFGFSLRERPRFLLAGMAAPGFCAAAEDLLKGNAGGGPWEKTAAFPVILENGSEKWLEITVTPADPAEDDTLLAVAREIPAPDAEKAEDASVSAFPSGADNIKAAVIDENWKITSMTSGFIREAPLLWGRTPEVGEPVLDLEPSGDEGLPFRLAAEKAFAGYGAEIGRESGGGYRVLSFAPIFSPLGRITGISLALCDRTGEKRAERETRAGEEKFRRLFSLVSDMAVIIARDGGQVLDCNRAFQARTGIGPEEARGRGLDELGLLSPGDARRIAALASGDKAAPAEAGCSLILPSGEELSVTVSAVPAEGNGAASLLAVIREDPREAAVAPSAGGCSEKRTRPEIHDREDFIKKLTREAESAERTRKPLSLIMLEIDGFGELQGGLGGGDGLRFRDDFFRELSAKIQPDDYAAALGPGEFAILTSAGGYIAHRTAEKVRAMVFSSKLLPGVHLSCSLGVSEFRREATPEEFMRRASIALREAKRAGGNRAVLAPAVS